MFDVPRMVPTVQAIVNESTQSEHYMNIKLTQS
jgi:hypothetical protein